VELGSEVMASEDSARRITRASRESLLPRPSGNYFKPFPKESDLFHLNNSIKLANSMLKDPIVRSYLDDILVETDQSALQLEEFLLNAPRIQKDTTNQVGHNYAGTPMKRKPDIILLNADLCDRLILLQKSRRQLQESRMLQVFTAFVLVHEIAHFLVRYSKKRFSPAKLHEAGVWIEKRVFNNEIRLQIEPSVDLNDVLSRWATEIVLYDGKERAMNPDYIETLARRWTYVAFKEELHVSKHRSSASSIVWKAPPHENIETVYAPGFTKPFIPSPTGVLWRPRCRFHPEL